MKKLVSMLVILFLIYFGIQYAYYFFGKGHETTYEINNEENLFTVREVLTKNIEEEEDNYYFEISINDTKFPLQTYRKFKSGKNVIDDILYFENEKFKCILPIFKGEGSVTDFLCSSGSNLYFYNSIRGQSASLDEFISKNTSQFYDTNLFADKTDNMQKFDNISVALDNLIDNHHIAIASYKGVTLLDNNIKQRVDEKTLFLNDVYDINLSAVASNYYVAANYNQERSFTEVFVVDITTGEIKTIKYSKEISFDSYIQGVLGDTVYLFDRDNKKQYEIDAKNLVIVEVGNEDTGIKFYDLGTWSRVGALAAANDNLIFNIKSSVNDITGYDYVVKKGNNLSGYYYFFIKNKNKFDVYRANVQSKDRLTYLFTTSNLERLVYVSDYVYFEQDGLIKLYNDSFGVKTIFENSEFKFNDKLYYSVYYK